MFRRLNTSLPKDPEFPADLEKLGYRIDEQDQIRSIELPHHRFHYWISKNERVLETHREAMHICIRRELSTRFSSLGLETTRLPPGTAADEPHIPILTTPNLRTASRILLFFGGEQQDLGILAYRILGDETLGAGSVADMVKAVKDGPQGQNTAIVIANPGQLVWHRRGKKAMSMTTWNSLPRKTGVDGPMRLDPVKNSVEGHRSGEEHVASVMAFVKESVGEGRDVAIDVLAVEEGAAQIARYLDRNWAAWEGKVRAICLGIGYVWHCKYELKNEKFQAFWGKRTRIYYVHPSPLGTPLHGREDTGCNCYGSGEPAHTECIMPKAHGAMLEFFDLVYQGYEEHDEDVEKDEEKEIINVVKWVDAKDDKTS